MQVVCCTLAGTLGRHLEGEAGKFDVVFVDEAAQVSLTPSTVGEQPCSCTPATH